MKKEITKLIIKEARRLKKTDEVEYCKPNCIRCLIAEAKGNIDEKLGIKMSFGDIASGFYGIPSMKTDYIMLDLIQEVEDGKIKL